MEGYQWCYNHRPDLADARRRNATKGGKTGGRGRPMTEVGELKDRLEDLAAGVLDGTMERGNAAVVNQIVNTRARLIELERKIREEDELVERLEALEAAQTQEQGGLRRWQV